MAKKLAPIHPGEVLLADFLEPLELSQYRLAHSISVPLRRINEIVHGTRAITADTALRLARFFGNSDRFCCEYAVIRICVAFKARRLSPRVPERHSPSSRRPPPS